MNNSNAITYLLLMKVKGFFRNLIRKPVSLILTLIGMCIVIFSVYQSLTNPNSNVLAIASDASIMHIVVGATVLFLLLVFFFNSKSALVYSNDASYIFSGPFSRKQIYTYISLLSVQQSIGMGLGYLIYILIFFASSLKSPLQYIGLLLSVFLHYLVTVSIFNYYYIKNASKEELSKISKFPVLVIIASILLISAFLIYPNFNMDGIKNVINHPHFKFVPYIGSVGWISNSFLLGDISAIIPIIVIILLIIVFTTLMFRNEGYFFEKAILDAETITAIQKEVQKNQNSFSMFTDDKLEKVSKRKGLVDFWPGAWAITSKQFNTLIKTRRILPFSTLMYVAIYVVMGLFIQELEFLKIMFVFSLLLSGDKELLLAELKKPFIYLIPDNNFKKALSLMVVPALRQLFLAFVLVVVCLLFGDTIVDALLFGVLYFSIYFVIQAVDYIVILLFKQKLNIFLASVVNLLAYLVALIPTIALAFLLLFNDPFLINTTMLICALFNFVWFFVLVFLFRNLLKGNDFSSYQ